MWRTVWGTPRSPLLSSVRTWCDFCPAGRQYRVEYSELGCLRSHCRCSGRLHFDVPTWQGQRIDGPCNRRDAGSGRSRALDPTADFQQCWCLYRIHTDRRRHSLYGTYRRLCRRNDTHICAWWSQESLASSRILSIVNQLRFKFL